MIRKLLREPLVGAALIGVFLFDWLASDRTPDKASARFFQITFCYDPVQKEASSFLCDRFD
jgi:hypothetical protein